MAAVINPRPAASTSSLGSDAKPELIQKVEGQLGRITGIHLLSKQDEEGFLTINEDRTLRVLLKRESGQFWPSIIQDLPNVPTKLFCDEDHLCVYVGLVNGMVLEYSMEADLNSLSVKRQWNVHTGVVTGLVYSPVLRQVFSCSKDKTLVWHSSETAQKLGSYPITSPCTTMQFDDGSKFIFLGDYSGNIYILRLVGNTVQLVSKLSAHTGAITDLAWDASKQWLFSSSTDSLVIMWDIGGKRGQCYEFNGHSAKVTRLSLAKDSRRLFSVDESGHLMCWDLKANRIMAPAWRDSDKCELCDAPFFWNLKVMWDRKIVGVRRHHCRTCGQSVCSTCSNHFTVFPAMGFEKPARICSTCHTKMEKYPEQFDLTPLAESSELRQGVVEMQLQESNTRLITVGYDRIIMLWNVAKML
ncbi:FYVE zinc finger domain-containing protein [Ditylenchus destructor]|nr:FYVE zinc finger domain-containing protein [Ditylenchus destructor]